MMILKNKRLKMSLNKSEKRVSFLEDQKFLCVECDKSFENENKYNNHRLNLHSPIDLFSPDETPRTSKSRKFKKPDISKVSCPSCNYQTFGKVGLSRHKCRNPNSRNSLSINNVNDASPPETEAKPVQPTPPLMPLPQKVSMSLLYKSSKRFR